MRAIVLLGLLATVLAAHADDALAPGRVLDATTAASAERLLPPEMLGRYRAGEF